MKAMFFVLFLGLLMVSCGDGDSGSASFKTNSSSDEVAPSKTTEARKVVVDGEQLEVGDEDLTFFEGKPFTGIGTWRYPDGQKEMETSFRDGKWHGLTTQWYENGQKECEVTLKEGKEHGLSTQWYENGQKKDSATCKDGKAHGLSTQWYENGQKETEASFKEGKVISAKGWHKNGKLMAAVQWKPNGEKCPVTKIDDNGNGFFVWYNDDGTEKGRDTYKDGELVED